MKNRIAFLIITTLAPFYSYAQIQTVLPISTAQNGSLTATAYNWQAIGVNPANLGWEENSKSSFTILDAGANGQSAGMSLGALSSALGSSSLVTRANSWQQILGAPNGMNVNADVNWFALSFRVPTIPGAFAVNMRDEVVGNGFLDINASQALIHSDDGEYNDATIMSFLNGTTLTYQHYREINFDYGVGLFNNGDDANDISKCFSFTSPTSGKNGINLYAGVGFKYIFGVADINGGVADNGLDALYDMNSHYPNIPGGFFNTPGHGYALDLGLGAKYKHWKFGLSVTDIGSIRWTHASVVNGDTNMAPVRNGNDLISELKTGTLAGTQAAGDYTTSLPTDVRLGASYKWSNKLTFSSDLIAPLNKLPGELQGPYFAVGAQWKTTKVVTLTTGIATAQYYGWGIPLGAILNATPHMQFYVGTTDITSYVGKRGSDVSLATWLFSYTF